MVDDVEVRFLGNHDRNLHFALLTDLPDSRSEPREGDPLVDLCAELIEGLNEKYAGHGMGSFLMLHRHRVYNPREKVWMGWERKRGKLMDLNRLLRQQYDSFPVKIGNLSILPQIRFVITLDSDTDLPRGSAQRMIGAIAHPLNQAIVDRGKEYCGRGLWHPAAACRSERSKFGPFAAGKYLFRGDRVRHLYARDFGCLSGSCMAKASSREKEFTKSIPCGRCSTAASRATLCLSHDLIEGAYARAGLASDIEVIEDYPSHYSAYNRRKHRWLRGDWQIAGWLLPRGSRRIGPACG